MNCSVPVQRTSDRAEAPLTAPKQLPTPSDTETGGNPLLTASYGASGPCPTCGHVPPLTAQEQNAIIAESWRRHREQLRRFVLEELDRNRPHGATNDQLARAHQQACFMAGQPCGTQPWDVTHALEHLESQGAARIFRRRDNSGYEAVKARLTIRRAELIPRLESLVLDIGRQEEL